MSGPVRASEVEKESGHTDAEIRQQRARRAAGKKLARKGVLEAAGAKSGTTLASRLEASQKRLMEQGAASMAARRIARARVADKVQGRVPEGLPDKKRSL